MEMDMTKPPSEDLDKFLLRMPEGLRNRVKSAAERNKRSMNAEIIDTLSEAYPATGFMVSEFVDEWLIPILRQDTHKKRLYLTGRASKHLESLGVDGVVFFDKDSAGNVFVTLKTDSVSVTIKETEATEPDSGNMLG
jgi:hypothetical protein